jgi:hypothetical protein
MSNDKTTLLGFARKSKAGNALNIAIDAGAFAKAQKFAGKDGREFVALVINADNLNKVMSGEKEVTSVSHFDKPVKAAE